MQQRSKTFKLILGAMFIALTAIGANITAIIPFLVIGGVPITLQTVFSILAGLVLGSRFGSFTLFAYMLIGLAGAPIFARFAVGIGMIISPTFGFVVAFIATAYVAGKIRERKETFNSYLIGAIVGLLVNYLIGTHWMYTAYTLWFEAPENFTYGLVWLWMALPFVKDFLLTVAIALVAYRLQKLGYVISNHHEVQKNRYTKKT